MELDMEKVMILLQRKYGAVREIHRLTKELEEVIARNDGISAAMVLQMRGDEMTRAEQCMEEIWQLGETDRETYEKLRNLVTSDPDETAGATKAEEKIYEIRRKTRTILEQVQEIDQRLNRRLAGDKSFYRTRELAGRT